MSEQQEQTHEVAEITDSLKIFQINLNKSEKAHLDIINKKVGKLFDIMLIQEPYTTTFNAI